MSRLIVLVLLTSFAYACQSTDTTSTAGQPPPAQPPASSARDAAPTAGPIVKWHFVALGDAGRSGTKIGCDDSLVAVDRQLTGSDGSLSPTLTQLLAQHDPFYGQSGLTNALAPSALKVDRAVIADGTADVQLSGTLTLTGTCDAPRVDAQLRETIRQFPGVTRMSISVNGMPLERALSAK